MNYSVLVKISRNEISFWQQNDTSSYEPLTKKEGYAIPLFFYINGSDFIMGNIARDRSNANDPNAYSNYFSLITETNYFKNYGQLDGHFLTEKTFKAISGKHPFILVGRPGLVESLRTLGYKSFAPHINESYDWIEDDELRLEAIMNEVERLCNFTDIEWMDFQTNVQSIVEHNFNLIANTGRNHPPKLTKA